jgi:hypothetical protein
MQQARLIWRLHEELRQAEQKAGETDQQTSRLLDMRLPPC